MKSGYTTAGISVDSENFGYGNLRFLHLRLVNVSGGTLGTTATNIIATTNLRPKQDCRAIGFDYTTGNAIRVGINTNGELGIYESVGVTQGNNQLRVTLIMPY